MTIDAEVEAYLRSVPADRRERLRAIHELIIENFPQARLDMRFRMPTYSVGEGWVALANRKQYISLYTCSASHIHAYLANHPRQKSGTGCINFRDRDAIHLRDLETVIRHAIEHPKQ